MKKPIRRVPFCTIILTLPLLLGLCQPKQEPELALPATHDSICAVPQSDPSDPNKAAQIVAYAATLLGTPYKVAGKDERGFDCSGYVSYVFKKFDITLPSSTRALIEVGQEVPLQEAEPGDIIFFTGTDPSSTEVGHAGIVVSHTPDSTRFIHSSSARSSACVKYTVLEASAGYQRRFMSVRRVLDYK